MSARPDPLAVMRVAAKRLRLGVCGLETANQLDDLHTQMLGLIGAGQRATDAFRAMGESTPFTRAADRCRGECEAAMLALDDALAPFTGDET